MADNLTKIIITAVDSTAGGLDSVRKGLSGVQSMAATLGVSLSAVGMVAFVKQSIDAADRLNDLSKVTHLTVEQLAGLQLAAKQSGTDLEGVAHAVSKMSVNMGANAEKFAQVGITAKDPIEALKQLADVYNSIPDNKQRDAFAFESLGKSWEKIAPLLAEGSDRIGEMVGHGTDLAGNIGELARQSDVFNDRIAVLEATLKGKLSNTLVDLLPLLDAMASGLGASASQAAQATGGLNPLVEILRIATLGFGGLYFTVKQGADALGGFAAMAALIADGGLINNHKQISAIYAGMNDHAKQGMEDFTAWSMSIIDAGKTAVSETAKVAATVGANTAEVKKFIGAHAGALSEYDKLIAKLKGGLVDATAAAQAAQHGYNKEQEKALELFASPEWAKMSQTQRINAAGIMEATIAQGMQIEAQKRAAEIAKELVTATVANQTALHGYTKEQAKALELFLSPAWATMSEAERAAAAATLENAIALGVQTDELEKARKATEDATKARQDSMVALSGEYDALYKKLEADKYELSIIGKTKEEIALLSAARGDDALQIKIQEAAQLAATGTDEQRLHMLREQIKLTLELRGVATETAAAIAADEAIKKQTEDWKKFTGDIESSLTDALMRGFESGNSFGENFVKTLEHTLKTAALKIVVQAMVNPIMSGVNSMAQGGSFMSGASSIGSLSSGYGMLATSGIGQALGLSAAMGPPTAAGAMGGASLTSLGSTLGAAMPWIGGALALYSLFKGNGGTPTASTGYANMNFDAQGNATRNATQYGVSNAATDSVVTGMAANYQNIAKQLGIGTVGTNFAYASNTGKDGKAPMFGLSGNGFGQAETAYSQAAVSEAASRAVFAALQGSELPKYLKDVFGGITASTATQAQIDSTLAFAGTLKQVRDGLTETRTPLEISTAQMTDLTKELHTSASTFKTDFVAAIDGGITPETLNKWGTLGTLIQQATDTASASVQSFTDDVMGLVSGIHASATGSIWNMQYGMQDNAGKYGMLDTKGAGLDAQMRGTKDIYKIADYAQKEIDLLNQSWGLLDAAQQKATFAQFQGKLTGIDNYVTQSGADAISLKKADNQMLSDAIAAAVEKALATLAIKMANAAIAQAAATSAMVGVVREPANVRVTVTAPRGSEVSLE